MNILFIVTESRSANGICCKAVMEELTAKGHRVYCVTNSEYTGFTKAKDVEYTTVKPRLTYRLFSKAELTKGLEKKVTAVTAQICNKLKLFLSIPTWPLISPAYSRRIYRAAYKLCKENSIDTIIPIYTQIDTLIAADKIKKKLPDIKFIPYFLDSFSGGYGPKIFSKEWTVKRGLWWERKLLPNADKIIMMKSSEAHYRKYSADASYYSKIVFLDLPLFNSIKKCEVGNILPKDKINLLYIGTIPMHIRNPEYFFKLFHSLDRADVQLNIVGTCTNPLFLQEWTKRDSRIKVFPFVEHNVAQSLMQSADILVNFGNNNSHMTPCKIFEYMSVGKPIISTAPIENEPSKVYLEKYPCRLIINEYKGRIQENADELNAFIEEKFVADGTVYSELEKVYYLNTPKAFVEAIM